MSSIWSNQLVVVGIGWILSRFRRDACYDDPLNKNIVTLSLGKLFPLRRFRDQYDATRFLNCDRIGKALVGCINQDTLTFDALVFRFTADRTPLLRYVRLVSIVFPKLEFILKFYPTDKGWGETVTFIAGKSSDDKCECDDDYDDYDDDDRCARIFARIPVSPHPVGRHDYAEEDPNRKASN